MISPPILNIFSVKACSFFFSIFILVLLLLPKNPPSSSPLASSSTICCLIMALSCCILSTFELSLSVCSFALVFSSLNRSPIKGIFDNFPFTIPTILAMKLPIVSNILIRGSNIVPSNDPFTVSQTLFTILAANLIGYVRYAKSTSIPLRIILLTFSHILLILSTNPEKSPVSRLHIAPKVSVNILNTDFTISHILPILSTTKLIIDLIGIIIASRSPEKALTSFSPVPFDSIPKRPSILSYTHPSNFKGISKNPTITCLRPSSILPKNVVSLDPINPLIKSMIPINT